MAKDPLQLLEEQHGEAERLLHAVRGARGEERGALLVRLTDLLLAHFALEEEVLYPAAAEVSESVADAFDEHLVLKGLLAQALRGHGTAGFDDIVAALHEGLMEHLAQERDVLFVEVRLLPRGELAQLADDMGALLRELASRGALHRQLLGELAPDLPPP